MANPWFRLYSEMVDDEKLRLLAFEDRWHYVAILCCKNSGLLDAGDSQAMLMRKLGVKLGLAARDLEAALMRLDEVGLIDATTGQPSSWEKRQYLPNKGMPPGEDSSDRRGYVYFIADNSMDRVKVGFSKNPWARLKGLQTGSSKKLSIICHVRTTKVSESEIHRLMGEYKISGEWFALSGVVEDCVKLIKSGDIKDADDLERMLANPDSYEVAATVATTTDTDTDTEEETEQKKKPSAPTARQLLDGVSDDVADDFIRIRKAKKAPITQTAVNGIRREADKAGLTLDQALTIACERGWQSFKAEWVANGNGWQAPTNGALQNRRKEL